MGFAVTQEKPGTRYSWRNKQGSDLSGSELYCQHLPSLWMSRNEINMAHLPLTVYLRLTITLYFQLLSFVDER